MESQRGEAPEREERVCRSRRGSPAWPGGGCELQRAQGRPEQVLPADSLKPGTGGFIRELLPEQEPAG